MADKYINETGVATIRDWANGKFAEDDDLDALSSRVDEIVAEGGEPNVIETVKVNDVALTPDAQKAVNIDAASLRVEAHTATIYGNGDNVRISENNDNSVKVALSGDDPYDFYLATTDYVEINGGKIDKIKVNGTEQAIDSTDKSVNLTVPTKVSDLTNDGDGTTGSAFATESYVDQNGGKIDKIKVNGTEQTITNKEVNLTVPTQVSDLTNDSNFQTDTEVQSAIDTAVASAYKYKGSVATVDDLPSSGNTTGDVYDVQATGMNYAWNGTAWDALGQYVDTSVLWTSTSGQTNSLIAMTTAEINAILEPSA